jgi:hypothetical protein
MNDRLKSAIASSESKAAEKAKARSALSVAGIAAMAGLGGAFGTAIFNYVMTEKQRTEISRELKDLQELTVKISQAAQKTAENVAATDAARLDTQRQLANIEDARLKIQQQVAVIDQSRYELQRESGIAQAKNEAKRVMLEEQARTQAQLIQANKLKNEIIPKYEINCFTNQFHEAAGMWDCAISNRGTQPFRSRVTDLIIAEKSTGIKIENAVASFQDSGASDVAPGVTLKHFTAFKLGPSASSANQRMFIFNFEIITEPNSVAQVKTATKGILSPSDIDYAAKNFYSHRLW